MASPKPTPDLPAGQFDQTQVSVILRRAIDLATDRRASGGETLTADDIAAVASEVGIPRGALATALAESRAGLEPKHGLTDRLVGPAKVSANTALPTDEATAAANLQRWLQVEHGLTAYVRQDGVVIASRRGGLPGALGAGMRRIHGSGGLDKVRSVRAATAAVDETGTVCVVADVSNKRVEAIVGGTAVTGGSILVIGMAAAGATPLALIALPVALVAGWGTARFTHRRTVEQVAEQVAFTSEAAARDEDPTHPVERLLRSGLSRRRPVRRAR